MAFVGRERERRAFDEFLRSPDAELVAVYGRRRVGKTFLIRELLRDSLVFELTGLQDATVRPQLAAFSRALTQASKSSLALQPPRDWAEAFDQLRVFLSDLPRRQRKRALFFDELPWLSSRRSGFLSAFEHFWNTWAVKQPWLIVVVCGSAASWMLENVVASTGGLHHRVTRRLRLEPFTLYEARELLRTRGVSFNDYQVLELYLALGGVPHYLKEARRGDSAAQAIDRICFSPDGLLRNEFHHVYASLFEHAERYERCVRALARHRYGMTRDELLEATGRSSGGATSRLLVELEESGFISSLSQFGHTTKDAVYRVSDEYSLFFLNWVERYKGNGQNAWLSRRSSPAFRAWSGLAFESVCLKHIRQIKRALGIEAVETEESTWRASTAQKPERGAQIDLVVDRKDHTVSLCELKFSEGEYTLDKGYAADLLERRETFRRSTGSKKTLQLAMVTTYGVKANAWRDELISRCVEMDALFVP